MTRHCERNAMERSNLLNEDITLLKEITSGIYVFFKGLNECFAFASSQAPRNDGDTSDKGSVYFSEVIHQVFP
jgi:hypothetical protein